MQGMSISKHINVKVYQCHEYGAPYINALDAVRQALYVTGHRVRIPKRPAQLRQKRCAVVYNSALYGRHIIGDIVHDSHPHIMGRIALQVNCLRQRGIPILHPFRSQDI